MPILAPPTASVSPTTAALAPSVPLLRRGKVRDVYDLGDALLMVASDRASAFDVVLPQPIPGKGEVLTLLSAWWFRHTEGVIENHSLTVDPARIVARYPALAESRPAWERRGMLVRKLRPYPVEAVVRGYLAGSAWREYSESGTLAGESLPEGLRQADPLPEPIFSPATKAAEGHDENISYARAERILGTGTAAGIRDASLALFRAGSETAAERGLILADTKFEFGRDEHGGPVLIDELLTPDSSRYWPREAYRPGGAPSSLDKQPLRDHLEELCSRGEWDKRHPGPTLPEAVLQATAERYREVFERLTRMPLDSISTGDLAEW